jgi:hypothetical protein
MAEDAASVFERLRCVRELNRAGELLGRPA